MTNEEAVDVLKNDIEICTIQQKQACEIAIKALEQQPSEDAVSRETIRELTKRMYLEVSNTDYDVYSISDCVSYVASKCRQYIDEHILDLPPVTPQPKTGHWIYTSKRRLIDETDEGCVYITDYRCTCSECGGDFGFQKMSDAYCKYCGAKMEVGE